MDRQTADTLTQRGIAALRTRDGATARACFADVIANPPAGLAPPWFLLSQACQMIGDTHGEDAALAALLAGDPRHLGSLLLMAALKARTGDSRAATSFYTTALAVAEQGQVPPQLVPLLDEGQRFLQQANVSYGDFLTGKLAAQGIRQGQVSRRIDAAIDLLLGRRQVYLQEPTTFYFPGLPQRQFYESEEFDWAAAFEAAAPEMVEELNALLDQQQAGFAPYVRTRADRPAPANPLRDDPSWGAHYLWEDGAIVPDHAALAPATMRALELAPIPVIAQRSPMALYSLLRPGTHIRPHNGMLNTRLICHLPLITNDQCGLRVGNETREWLPGKLLIFDDSIEHEAWNRGSATRIILLFEIWRPEITTDERMALTAIFEAISAYADVPRDQG